MVCIVTTTEAITDGSNGGAGETSGGSSSTVIGVVVVLILAVVVVTVIIIATVIIIRYFIYPISFVLLYTPFIFIIPRRRGKSKYTPNESVKFSKGSQYKPHPQLSTGNEKSAKDVEANSEHDEEQTYENTVSLGKK